MNKYLKQSIILHVAVFLAMWIDMPSFWHHDMTLGQNPIIVDLSQVKIDEFTNLPTKAEFGPEDQKATVTEHKEQYTQETAAEPEPQKAEEKPDSPEQPIEEPKEDFMAPPEPEKKPVPEKQPEKKPTAKKPPVPTAKPKPKPQPKPEKQPDDAKKKELEEKKVRSNALKSLMQEIDNDRNIDLGSKNQKAMIKEGTQVNNMGIEGGNSKGSYFSDLTISETDAIASLLRQNWNLDPGAMGIDGMVVEIRVFLERDGSIKEIEFVDKARYNTDPNYRSVAESARRAVIQTQGAFKQVFGQKYADKYDVWSTLRLYFDPLDKGVR